MLAGSGAYAGRNTVYIGADGKILEIDGKVSPKSAGADIVAKLEKFGIARREED